MNKKRLSYLLSILIVTVLVFSPVLIVGTAPLRQNETNVKITNGFGQQETGPKEDSPAGLSNGTFTFLEPPYLSPDGNSLKNAVLPRALVVDTNPDMQNLRFPQDADTAAAIAGTRSTRVNFSITYAEAGTVGIGNSTCIIFPTRAKTVFDAAIAIWASRIQSSVPITITACWTRSLEYGVLAIAGGSTLHRDFPGAPRPNTWYIGALANSFAGYDLEPTNADMHIALSDLHNWYYGTDGFTPNTMHDLLTVVLHEIAHGLQFTGSVVHAGSFAFYGYPEFGYDAGNPTIYDTFIESGGGTKLTSYPNRSIELADLVTSDNLWWNGTNANTSNVGSRVKMFAPSPWQLRSSYSHLDYNTFAGTINSLMVHAISAGSSQHNPGPVTIGILKDMGWNIDDQPPPPPVLTGVSASDGTFTDKVRVTWGGSGSFDNSFENKLFLPLILALGSGPIPEASYFQVYRSTTDSLATAIMLADNHPGNPYDDTSAIAGITYYYWVKACNTAGCSDFSAPDSGYRANTSAPSPPTGVSASEGTYIEKVQVSWTASADTINYQVFRNTTNSSAGAILLTSSHPSSPYEDTSVEERTTYYYWVKACNTAGCSAFSAANSGWSATTTIANGDFEAGPDGSWTEYASNGRDIIVHESETDVLYTQQGEWLAWLGGADNQISRISQTVTISYRQYLFFLFWIDSDGDCANDFFYVKINDDEIIQIDLCQNTPDWVGYTLYLLDYEEQTVTITFEVKINSGLISNVYLDNISLESY